MKPLEECRLYTFVDTTYLSGRKAGEVARQLCEGGADLIQLRAKGIPKDKILRMAEEIAPIAQEAGVWLVINDHLDIAQQVGAPLCHLGQEDFFDAGYVQVSDLPQTEGANPIKIGLSTHAPDQAARAVKAGADYVAIGPVFPTGTKPGAKPVTLEYVRWAAANVAVPWFAIGGITLENLESVMNAGARRICVVSAILNGEDIKVATEEFNRRLSDAA